MVSTLIRITGDWSLAEDCTADAFEKAIARWPSDGIPDNPGAWLTTVAKNKALDKLRRAANEARKLEQIAIMNELEADDVELTDDRLRLIFTCCHPALPLEARVALTLRTVAGLTTPEIASAFLVPEPTMAQRLVRAQKKIKNAGIPYRVPSRDLLPERLGGVLAVLYLLFNEGYTAVSRVDLAEEAIRLTRVLLQLMPGEPEVRGLLALELLQHSRRHARLVDGELVPLEEQDRGLWDSAAVEEGLSLVVPVRSGPGGRYHTQAAIAAVHARDDGDYSELVALYDRLGGGAVIALNRAVAVGMAHGPEAGLAAIEALPASDYYLVPAARADFLRRLGRDAEAAVHYRLALDVVRAEPERKYLARRLAEVEG